MAPTSKVIFFRLSGFNGVQAVYNGEQCSLNCTINTNQGQAVKSNAANFETPEVRALVQQMEQIEKSPEGLKLEKTLYTDERRFFFNRVIPGALAFEALALTIGFVIGSPAWAMATVTVVILGGVVAFRPR